MEGRARLTQPLLPPNRDVSRESRCTDTELPFTQVTAWVACHAGVPGDGDSSRVKGGATHDKLAGPAHSHHEREALCSDRRRARGQGQRTRAPQQCFRSGRGKDDLPETTTDLCGPRPDAWAHTDAVSNLPVTLVTASLRLPSAGHVLKKKQVCGPGPDLAWVTVAAEGRRRGRGPGASGGAGEGGRPDITFLPVCFSTMSLPRERSSGCGVREHPPLGMALLPHLVFIYAAVVSPSTVGCKREHTQGRSGPSPRSPGKLKFTPPRNGLGAALRSDGAVLPEAWC